MPIYGKVKIKKHGSKLYGQRGHVLPSAYTASLYENTRLKTKHVLHYTRMSHTSLYRKIAAGTFPQSDSKGVPRVWKVATILEYLEKHNPAAAAELVAKIKGKVLPLPDFMLGFDNPMEQAKKLGLKLSA
jgi:predicted DNA-binding transcriptional regulator AlpA